MIKRFSGLLAIVLIITTLTGCWDFEDANKKSFMVSVGVDKVNDNVEITGEATAFVSTRGAKEAQSQQTQQSFFQYSGIGKDFETARLNIDQEVTHSFFLGETRTVIFGRSCAEDEIASYLSRIDNLYDYRKNLLIVISREPAKEILSFRINRNIGIGFYIENNIKTLTRNSGAIYTNLKDILPYKRIEGTGFFLPYIGIEKGSIRYLGLGVIKNYKLVDFIKIEDSDGILFLLNKKPVISEDIPLEDNKNKAVFKVYVKKRKIVTDYKENKVIINVYLNVDASLQYLYYMEPVSDDYKKELQIEISKKIKDDILKNINQSQNEYVCDAFGFFKYFRAQNPKIYKSLNWQDSYVKANVNVNINTKIINTNLKDTTAKNIE